MADDEEARRLLAEIEARLAPQPTTFDQERDAIAKDFEGRREEARAHAAVMAKREFAKTKGDINDPEMAATLAQEAERIRGKWDESATQAIDRYDLQEAQRMERLRAEWNVELQPAPRQDVIEAERKRTDDELERVRVAAEDVMNGFREKAKRETEEQPDRADEIATLLKRQEQAAREAFERLQARVEEEARARLERMLEPYGRDR
jgi:hypothetical protein